MESVRLGLAVRALRRRQGWTQEKLAAKASLSQAAVSRVERGHGRTVTLRTIERIAEALGARTSVRLLWHGEDLERLLDAVHAGLVETVIEMLRQHGWDVVTEATFSIFGERGSVDVLAYHRALGALLVVEVKSVVPDIQGLIAGMDRKARLAPQLGRDRGWPVRSVSRLLVRPVDRTARRRIARYAATFDQALPVRTVAVRHWLDRPNGAIGGVLFVPISPSTTARHRIGSRNEAPARARVGVRAR
jgi:transcriptional regulator with XRE-family HTH domain